MAVRSRPAKDPVRSAARAISGRNRYPADRGRSQRHRDLLCSIGRTWCVGLFRRDGHAAGGDHLAGRRIRPVLLVLGAQSRVVRATQCQRCRRRIHLFRKSRGATPCCLYRADAGDARGPAVFRLRDRDQCGLGRAVRLCRVAAGAARRADAAISRRVLAPARIFPRKRKGIVAYRHTRGRRGLFPQRALSGRAGRVRPRRADHRDRYRTEDFLRFAQSLCRRLRPAGAATNRGFGRARPAHINSRHLDRDRSRRHPSTGARSDPAG